LVAGAVVVDLVAGLVVALDLLAVAGLVLLAGALFSGKRDSRTAVGAPKRLSHVPGM